MEKFDKIFFGFIIGFIFPAMIGLLSVIIWFYTDKQENHALIYLLIGLLFGLLIDFIFLKRLLNKRYVLPIWFVIGIYILFNVGMFGFFMGFPVFNLLSGLVAGYYFGKRIGFMNIQPDKHPKIINQVSSFTALIMTFICTISGIIALTDYSTGENIRIMIGLNFEISKTIILMLIIVGGFSLILAQYFITRFIMKRTIK